jgi:hypothetical protein
MRRMNLSMENGSFTGFLTRTVSSSPSESETRKEGKKGREEVKKKNRD